jgi:hypothetical protein
MVNSSTVPFVGTRILPARRKNRAECFHAQTT